MSTSIFAMKVQGITPEYAQAMAKVGFGKPSAGRADRDEDSRVLPGICSGLHAAGLTTRHHRGSDFLSHFPKVTPQFLDWNESCRLRTQFRPES